MGRPRWWVASVASVALAMIASACGSGGSEPAGDSGGAPSNSDATVSIYGTEPENTLLPANTNEAGGSKAAEALYVGLVGFRPDDGATFNAVAESITSSDAKVYDITIKKGWKFHDGTEVRAKNFVEAWNWAAYAPNAQQTAPFFEQIQGYEDVHPADPDDEDGPLPAPAPKTDKMSGLEVTGDYQFRVTLTGPFSVFTSKIGYLPFAPLPDVFFADPEAFADHPIGNGPMKFVSRTPNSEIKLTRFDEYTGEDKVHFKNLDIKIYQSQEAAYQDLLAGNLDFMETIPPSAKVGNKYQADLGDQVLHGNLLTINSISIPYYVPGYDNLDLRRAISLAINREQITRTVFNGTHTPADAWVPPGIEGHQPVCGEWCKYDPVRAKEFFIKSGFTGTLTIASNEDGGRREPLEAACNSIKNALGVECNFLPATNFGQFRQQVNAHQLTGMSRSDWAADYPSIENFLNPRFRTGGASNDPVYSSPRMDELLRQADATADKNEAIKIYQQAHALLAEDLPTIPVWVESGLGARSKNLKAAVLNFKRQPELSSFEVAG